MFFTIDLVIFHFTFSLLVLLSCNIYCTFSICATNPVWFKIHWYSYVWTHIFIALHCFSSVFFLGTAGDSLSLHRDMAFSTKDRDNDISSTSPHCAEAYKGGWWYESCHLSNLNGRYLMGQHSYHAQGVIWYHWKSFSYSVKRAEMKIKPVIS